MISIFGKNIQMNSIYNCYYLLKYEKILDVI